MNTLVIERHDRVVTVTLDRPPVNAVTLEMQHELSSFFGGLAEDKSVGAVVLAAAGDRAFCAGIDLKEVAADGPAGDSLQALTNPGWQWRATQHVIRHAPVPVIAAVERPAIGAGFGLIGVCDIIIAAERATFALTEINVGLLGGGSKAMRLLGPQKARMMLFTGRPVSAADMYRLGAVEEVVPDGQALPVAQQLAAEIASKSPLAIRMAKESMVRIEGDEVERQYRTEWDYTNRLGHLNDSREAMSAYLEKREPEWSWS